ncbi:sigma-70 family RNA polymerase sigma factor [Streptomyces sp. NPDC046821]|uniref:sigma-70 family RNA polymerase sigma factor n=1 Tax=Streptomyces sp. NPDC046821 TaxID=3154702 RepID=UPI0033D73A86
MPDQTGGGQATHAQAKTGPRNGPEPEFITRARSGDRRAFAVLYRRHRDTVYAAIVRQVRNRELAEDLTQEVFVRALRRIETFTWQGKSIDAWLQTIARNLIADHYKSSWARREVPTGEWGEWDRNGDRNTENTEDTVIHTLLVAEARKVVGDALPFLNAHQRTCLRLRFLEELSVYETARLMGRQPNAVRSLQYRAMRSMTQLVQATWAVGA